MLLRRDRLDIMALLLAPRGHSLLQVILATAMPGLKGLFSRVLYLIGSIPAKFCKRNRQGARPKSSLLWGYAKAGLAQNEVYGATELPGDARYTNHLPGVAVFGGMPRCPHQSPQELATDLASQSAREQSS